MELTRAVEHMTLRDPQFRLIMNENKQACLDMGFQEQDFSDTVQELRNRGNIRPTLEDIVDNIAIVVENREAAERLKAKQNETPEEENRRLRSIFICMMCEKNKVNTLFLPCTHHRLCKQCAEPLKTCPVCGINIREKIKTYLG